MGLGPCPVRASNSQANHVWRVRGCGTQVTRKSLTRSETKAARIVAAHTNCFSTRLDPGGRHTAALGLTAVTASRLPGQKSHIHQDRVRSASIPSPSRHRNRSPESVNVCDVHLYPEGAAQKPRSPGLQSPLPQFDSGRRLPGDVHKITARVFTKLSARSLSSGIGARLRANRRWRRCTGGRSHGDAGAPSPPRTREGLRSGDRDRLARLSSAGWAGVLRDGRCVSSPSSSDQVPTLRLCRVRGWPRLGFVRAWRESCGHGRD